MAGITKVTWVDTAEKLRLAEPDGSSISILMGANLVKSKKVTKLKSTKKRKENKDG